MATRQALRMEGESAAEMPHMRQTSFSCLLIVCREHSPSRILQSAREKHHGRTELVQSHHSPGNSKMFPTPGISLTPNSPGLTPGHMRGLALQTRCLRSSCGLFYSRVVSWLSFVQCIFFPQDLLVCLATFKLRNHNWILSIPVPG